MAERAGDDQLKKRNSALEKAQEEMHVITHMGASRGVEQARRTDCEEDAKSQIICIFVSKPTRTVE
ncbi:hypothetical protein KSD_16420 [Ktedonobacter sp. SOSP1-85]|nr:hypothetical protein KSD_16420 [Ktedonobacter sp. SOSP1-85]